MGCRKDFSFTDKILCPGFPLDESVKKGYLHIRRYSDVIGSSSVKTVVDIGTDMLLIITSMDHELASFINIDDLKRP